MVIAKPSILIICFLLCLWIGAEAIKVLNVRWMPVRFVRVEGNFQYISKAAIKNKILPLVTTSLFAANIQSIQAATMAMPWVKQVKIKRIWPDTIDIRVYEQQPTARWREDSLLNIHGEVFKPKEMKQFSSLLRIDGPDGYEKRLFEIIQGLQAALADQSLGLQEFSVSERRSWKLQLNNGMELQLGKVEPLQKFQRLLKTLPVLAASSIDILDKIRKVDMRYPNGFAITWKPGVELDLIDALKKEQIRQNT